MTLPTHKVHSPVQLHNISGLLKDLDGGGFPDFVGAEIRKTADAARSKDQVTYVRHIGKFKISRKISFGSCMFENAACSTPTVSLHLA
jgi:hypothetical protein